MSWEPILMLHALLGEHRANWVVFMCLKWLGVNSSWKSEAVSIPWRGSGGVRTPASPSTYGRWWMSRWAGGWTRTMSWPLQWQVLQLGCCAARRCHHLVLPASSHCAICADHVGRRTGGTIFLPESAVALKSNCSAGVLPVWWHPWRGC